MQVPASIDPTSASWWGQWGPIGAVAGLALLALGWWVRLWIREAGDRSSRQEAVAKAQQDLITALQSKLTETIQQAHRETIALVDTQRRAHEEAMVEVREAYERRADAGRAADAAKYQTLLDRYQALIERSTAASDTRQDKLQEIASASVRALEIIGTKLPATRGPRP